MRLTARTTGNSHKYMATYLLLSLIAQNFDFVQCCFIIRGGSSTEAPPIFRRQNKNHVLTSSPSLASILQVRSPAVSKVLHPS